MSNVENVMLITFLDRNNPFFKRFSAIRCQVIGIAISGYWSGVGENEW